LFSIPAMIFLGFSSPVAIATVKFGALGTMGSGLFRFHKSQKVDYPLGIKAAVCAVVGSFIGANIMISLSSELLKKLTGVLILFVFAVILLKGSGLFSLNKKISEISSFRKYFGFLLFFLVGIWGGIFGGQAIFATYILILVFGKSFLESAATRKITGIAIAVIALVVYAFNHIIDWQYGAILITGTVLGSYLGASYSLKKGEKWVQRLFLIIVSIMAVKLIIG